MGKLIVIDGLDGSGKQTQTACLEQRLQEEGYRVKTVHFPDYDQPSSALVKQYLQGDFGSAAEVSAYAASSFYAVDRYASFKGFWERDYQGETVILADRYVTSNLIHQMGKLDRSEWDIFADWLCDYEYRLLGLPKPDLVVYLDVEPSVSRKLLEQRYASTGTTADIHEGNFRYLLDCRKSALYAKEKFGWEWVNCSPENTILSVETIAKLVYTKVISVLQTPKK